MIYIDTNVVIAYINAKDPLHVYAHRLVEKLRREGFIVSNIVTLELYSVYSRTMGLSRVELEALVEYSTRVLDAVELRVDCEKLLSKAMRDAGTLRLRTLDLLHVVAAHQLGATGIATLDRDIVSRRDVVKKRLGLEVYTEPPREERSRSG